MEILTDPGACARWSPLPFTVESLSGDRVTAGATACLCGRAAGRDIRFEVEFEEVSEDRLSLHAEGAIKMSVTYELATDGDDTELTGAVEVESGGGFTGRIIAAAAAGLLEGGLWQKVVGRIASDAESQCTSPSGELVAA